MWNFCSGRPFQRGRVSLTGRRRRLPASGMAPLRLIGGGLGEGASWANPHDREAQDTGHHGRSQGEMVVRPSFSRLVVGELEGRGRFGRRISKGGPLEINSLAGSAFLRSYSELCAKAARPRGHEAATMSLGLIVAREQPFGASGRRRNTVNPGPKSEYTRTSFAREPLFTRRPLLHYTPASFSCNCYSALYHPLIAPRG